MYLNRSERTRQAVIFGFRKTLSITSNGQCVIPILSAFLLITDQLPGNLGFLFGTDFGGVEAVGFAHRRQDFCELVGGEDGLHEFIRDIGRGGLARVGRRRSSRRGDRR